MRRFSKLIEHIEEFISKYYKNEMIKGGIIFVSFLLLSYALVATLEYLGRFGSNMRLFLLITFIGVNTFLLFKFLIIPVLKLYKLTRHLSLKDASSMIGSIFPDINDKLKNTLELNDKQIDQSLNLELVKASIEQRSKELSIIPFSTGIDFKENRKYLKFLIPIFFTIVLIGLSNPNFFLDSSERLVNFNKEYVEPAPFDFVMQSDKEVKEGEDYTLMVKLVGDEIPDEVKIHSNLGEYNLIKKSKVLFEYTFNNLDENLNFYCEANDFKSQDFSVNALRKPIIEDLSIQAIYPKHTKRKNETFTNTGDITVPEGTLLKWNVNTKNMNEMSVLFPDSTIRLNTSITNSYSFQSTFYKSQNYKLLLSSKDLPVADSLDYSISVIKDKYPTITVNETVDSSNTLKRFVEGKVSDDYGFRSLLARINVIGKDTSYAVRKSIRVNSDVTTQMFSHFIDLSLLDLNPGDRVEYSFVVTDNDKINGYKSTSSSRQIFNVPELNELDNSLSEQSENLQKEMDNALQKSSELKKKIKDVKSNMMNKESTDWKDRQSLQNLLDIHKELEKKVKNLQKDFDRKKNEEENFFEMDEEMKDKQEKLQELLDELMDDELKELLEELQELMDEMNKEKVLDNLEQMENETEEMEDMMDRTLELFKNMELDKKLENIEKQLMDLKEQQDELQEMTENESLSEEELSKKQEELNKKFDDIQEDIEDAKKKNSELEKPRDIEFDKEKEESIDSEMNESKENLDKGKNKKSSENQKNASEMMEEMADDVSSMQSQSQQQQQGEDMDALRYLLENIVSLSHDQEDLMDEYRTTSTSDPYYLQLNRDQLAIDKATDVVRDSLKALSKRVYQLSSFITEELSDLNYNLENANELSEERNTKKLLKYQQYAMTDYNDLALMLSEVLEQMQQQAQAKMQGNGSCSKPGGSGQGKSGPMNMQQMKEALKDQIGKMKNGKKPGGKEGQNKPGQDEGKGMNGKVPGLSTKEQVKMAAKQAQIRESLKQLKEELNKDGSGFGNNLNDLIEDVDELQEDLVKGNVDDNFVKRQEDILTRLLESEKAIRERGFSEERESNEGKNFEEGNQIDFTEYNRKKKAEVEFLRSMPLSLQVYYKTLVNEYFNSVNN